MIGIALAVAGTAISMYGKKTQGDADEAMARYNAKVAAARGRAEGRALDKQADNLARTAQVQQSAVRLQMANRGLELSGSPLIAMTSSMADSMADINETRRQASIARRGGEVQSGLLTAQASSIKSGVGVSLLASGISGASNVASAYGTYRS